MPPPKKKKRRCFEKKKRKERKKKKNSGAFWRAHWVKRDSREDTGKGQVASEATGLRGSRLPAK